MRYLHVFMYGLYIYLCKWAMWCIFTYVNEPWGIWVYGSVQAVTVTEHVSAAPGVPHIADSLVLQNKHRCQIQHWNVTIIDNIEILLLKYLFSLLQNYWNAIKTTIVISLDKTSCRCIELLINDTWMENSGNL